MKSIPTYIINLKNRKDRKLHVLKEFKDKKEFSVDIVDACEHEIGAIGLWNSIQKIIKNLPDEKEEFILICEDDHQFTENYSIDLLFHCIVEAKNKEAYLLSGGVSWFDNCLQVSENIFWMEKFTGTQFIIIFNQLYKLILETDFGINNTADYKIASLTNKLFVIHPFISVQKEFGYSDVTLKNNLEERVEALFAKSNEGIQILKDVALHYKNLPKGLDELDEEILSSIKISTFVINLPERIERKQHIMQQFEGRDEFDITIIDACKHKIGAVGLWQSIRKIIEKAINNDEDVIVICEDDHEFSKDYNKSVFIKNVIEAHQQGVDYLSGGTGNFCYTVPLSPHRYWVNPCSATQFIVVYRKFFERILNEPYDDTVIADILLSEMTSNKMVLYPFISIQKDFGYSDVTPIHNEVKGLVTNLFNESSRRLGVIKNMFQKYHV
jgi:GR25 family glycosyltransferase involved in LPS biosynthesis